MAVHLDDPPAPVLKGVERWDWPVYDGLKRKPPPPPPLPSLADLCRRVEAPFEKKE